MEEIVREWEKKWSQIQHNALKQPTPGIASMLPVVYVAHLQRFVIECCMPRRFSILIIPSMDAKLMLRVRLVKTLLATNIKITFVVTFSIQNK